MARTLDAILSVARERISGSNPAGRNTGSPVATTTGTKPGVDYASKSSGDRAFVAKHTHIEQEYPNGMGPVFKGEPTEYVVPKTPRMGNTEAEAMAANEEVQLSEVSKAALRRFKSGMAQALNDKKEPPKKDVKEEVLDEVWKATQNEKGEHILKHKSGKVSSKSYGSKGEAIDAAVRKNKASGAFKEALEDLDADDVKLLIDDTTDIKTNTKPTGPAGPAKAPGPVQKGTPITHPNANDAEKNKAKKTDNGAMKEEAEALDEISKELAGRYKKKASADYWKSEKIINKTIDSDKATAHKHLERQNKRYHGITAADKRIKEEMDVEEGAILTCKDSLGRKLDYHKVKMKNEDIGSVKFRHHQKQIHIIKGMMEEVELEEKKKEDNTEIKLNKRGFLEKKRKYQQKEKKDVKEEVQEQTSEMDPQVARIVQHISREKY